VLEALSVIATPTQPVPPGFHTWTDDYSNLFSVLDERD
jgi:hypothetical protein